MHKYTSAPSRTVASMPIRLASAIVHARRVALCPTVTLLPMVMPYTGLFPMPVLPALTSVPSCRLLLLPMLIVPSSPAQNSENLRDCARQLKLASRSDYGIATTSGSPFSTQPYQTEALLPRETSPTTAALGATKTSCARTGLAVDKFITVRCLETAHQYVHEIAALEAYLMMTTAHTLFHEGIAALKSGSQAIERLPCLSNPETNSI